MLNVKVIVMGEMNEKNVQNCETHYFINAINAGIHDERKFFIQTNAKEFAGKGKAIDLSGVKGEYEFPVGKIEVIQWEGDIYIINKVGTEWRPETWNINK